MQRRCITMTIQSHRRYLSKRIVGGDGICDPTDFTIDSGGLLRKAQVAV
jgi:hypothetical protein